MPVSGSMPPPTLTEQPFKIEIQFFESEVKSFQFKTYLEGEILLSASIVGFCPVCVKVDGQRLARQGLEEEVLPHQLLLEVVHFGITVGVSLVHPSLEAGNGVLTVSDFLVDAAVEGGLGRVAVRVLLVQP